MNLPVVSSEVIKAAAANLSYILKKHAPKITFALGLAAGAGCVITACKQTRTVDDILEEVSEEIENVKEEKEVVDKSEYARDLTKTYIVAAGRVAKHYAVPVVLGVASVGFLCGSHHMMTSRNAALSAAFAGVSSDFNKYRERVRKNLGEEVDKQLRYGIEQDRIEIPNEDKRKKPKVETVKHVDPDLKSPYIFYFDSRSREWEKDPEYNKVYLIQLQNYFNQQLKSRKHVFLNEILRALDIPETREGQVCGWIYYPNNSEVDNFIDFGILESKQQATRDFVNGYEDVVLLDFNCQGNIVNLL